MGEYLWTDVKIGGTVKTVADLRALAKAIDDSGAEDWFSLPDGSTIRDTTEEKLIAHAKAGVNPNFGGEMNYGSDSGLTAACKQAGLTCSQAAEGKFGISPEEVFLRSDGTEETYALWGGSRVIAVADVIKGIEEMGAGYLDVVKLIYVDMGEIPPFAIEQSVIDDLDGSITAAKEIEAERPDLYGAVS